MRIVKLEMENDTQKFLVELGRMIVEEYSKGPEAMGPEEVKVLEALDSVLKDYLAKLAEKQGNPPAAPEKPEEAKNKLSRHEHLRNVLYKR